MIHNSSAPAGMSLLRMSMGYALTQKKVFLVLALLLSMLFLSALSAEAASIHCVRAGASGSNNGSDWTNAYTSLPATLVRGDTYYIADGSYSGYTFNTAVSGSTYIYIKKATIIDHGTSTGWSDTYGDGQAVFGPLGINTSNGGYLDINGQFEYGFKVDFNEGYAGFELSLGGPHIHLSYIDFDGVASAGDYNYTASTKAIYNHSGAGNTDDFIVSHCALHGGETLIQWEQGNYATFEYCNMYDNRSINSNWHSNIMYATGNAHDITFRHNKVHNFSVEGIFITGYGGSNMYNWYIYGNVFYDGGSVARGLELRQDYSYGAFYFYNNTCSDLPLGCVHNVADGTSGGAIRNNIGYNAGFGYGSIPNSNNSNVSSSAFVNYAGKDFHLAAPTAAGYTLSSPYNTEMDGKTRGADGVWDVGAYEYGIGGAVLKPNPPNNLR